jgi:putative endonuclease
MQRAADEVVAWVYLLRCLADDSLYTGWTVDLNRRLAAHRAGTGARYTRSRLPVELALALPMPDASSARREEARIKRLRRSQKLVLIDAARSGVHMEVSHVQSAAR